MYKLAAAAALAGLIFSSPLFAAARVTVAHFAPFADTVDGTAVNVLVNGDVALENVKFKDFTPYIEFEAGTYTIDIVPVGATEPAISREFMLEDGNDYTVFAGGDGVKQPLALFALLDNTTMPDMGNLNLRIVHAAPFAADLAATEVSIRTDGGDIVAGLVGVPFGVDSGFFQVPAGNYNLKIATNDGTINLIDILPVDLPAGADVTVFAVGDGMNQALAVIAVPVGELATTDPVDNRSNGLWTIVNSSGYGFILQPMPWQNRLVGKWFQPDAMGNPTYLLFDSCEDDTNEMGEFECSTPGGFDGMTAKTYLWNCTGGSVDGSDQVACVDVGEIDFEILGCDDSIATVTLDGQDPVMFEAKQLTRPFPCTDEAPAQ